VLKLAITAGIGSDHVDLDAAIKHGMTVAEVTYSNSISVAEHVVMMILGLVRNYLPSHQVVLDGGWNIRLVAVRPDPVRRRHAGDPGVVAGGYADPRRVPDRRRRPPGRGGRSQLLDPRVSGITSYVIGIT